MKDYYKQISDAIYSYERLSTKNRIMCFDSSVHWITNRIEWCWKFKHITEEQKNELVDRICFILDNEHF